MSLRVLLLRKQLEDKKNKLGLIDEELKEIKKREDETAKAIEEIDETESGLYYFRRWKKAWTGIR